jgi:hypothetical protein
MQIYKYDSIEAVNHGINKLEALGWEVLDVEIKVFIVPKGEAKESCLVEMFYVYVEKDLEKFEKTLEKSLISRSSFRDDL